MLTDKTEDKNHSNDNLTFLFLQDIKNQLAINWKVESSSENKVIIISPLIGGKIGKISLCINEKVLLIEDIISVDDQSLNHFEFQLIFNSFLENCICNIKEHDQFDIQMGDKYI